MCGICGFVDSSGADLNPGVLQVMRGTLTHRGPDDAGSYLAPGVALGSRRLSVIDLSQRGHMPMATSDNRYWITYNGEVYNFYELRRSLEARGFQFHSNTDTEVVLALYAHQGPAMLDRLNGMFAFAMLDNIERSLFPWNWPHYPANRKTDEVGPWFEAFTNAREWIKVIKN